jgi:hypothetical protein
LKVTRSHIAPRGLSSRSTWAMTSVAARAGRTPLPLGRFAIGFVNEYPRMVRCDIALGDARAPGSGAFAHESVEAPAGSQVFLEFEELPLAGPESNGVLECLYVVAVNSAVKVDVILYA